MTGGGQRQGRTERPTLAELQQAFQAAVLGTEDSVLSHLRAGARAGRETLFGVYRSAYAGRLVGVLRTEYPHLAAYLGDGAFDRMARGYITAHPSQHPNARWVGNRLPEYLADECVARAHPEFAELAVLERALANAFDASDSPLLTLQDLADVPPERWSDLVFRPHPSAARLDEAHNTLAIWSALKEDATPPPPCREADIVHLLVWRRDGRATVRRLGPEEAMLWDEAARGVPFGQLCELAAVFDDLDKAPVRVAGTLRGWLESGLVTKTASAAEPATVRVTTG